MKFEDHWVDRDKRFALGLETGIDRYYLSIPVSNTLVDHDEYYTVDRHTFDCFLCGEGVHAFLAACRARQNDALLLLPTGRDQGVPS